MQPVLGGCFTQMKEIDLQRNNILTTLPSVGPEYSVSFDLLVDKHTLHDYRNVLHLTTKGDGGQLGYRIPGVWLTKDNTLYIASTVNGDDDYVYVYKSVPLKEGQMYKIQIQQVKRNDKVGS